MRAGYNLTPLLLSLQKDAAVAKLAAERQGDVTEGASLGFQQHCSMFKSVIFKSLDKPKFCIPYKTQVQNSESSQLRVKVLIQIKFSTDLSL